MELNFRDKKILVTGGSGSIGREIVYKVLKYDPKVVRIFGNDEAGQFSFQQDLKDFKNVRFLLGNIRDKDRLKRAIEDIDIVFHAAALKHVPMCEYNPFEAVKTNVIGTQNVIEASLDEGMEKVIAISTDKAVNPANVMGATKLLSERLVASANYYKGTRKTIFSCVRFGNVLCSQGSVVTVFKDQIKLGGPITVTDLDMTRFVMSSSQAVDLVLKATEMAQGGEVFIFKMPVLRLKDLAEVMIENLAPKYGYTPEDIKIETIGIRPGEKLYEELMTEDEALTSCETDEMFIMLPQITKMKGYDDFKPTITKKYASKDGQLLSKDKIKELLYKDGLI